MTPTPPPSRNALLKWSVRLVLGLLLAGVLVVWQGAGVRQALASASWSLLLTGVLCYLSTQFLSALRWRVLLHTASLVQANTGAVPCMSECFRIYLIGMFWNLWMPTAIGGDAMRAYLVSRHTNDLPLATSSVLADRLSGFVALILIGATGLILQLAQHNSGNNGDDRVLRTLLLASGTLIAFVALVALARALAYRLESRQSSGSTPTHTATGWKIKITSFWIKLHRALDAYLAPPSRGSVVVAVLLSLVLQCGQIAINVFLARAVGLEVPLITFIWLIPSLALASMLPLGIGGLGVREAAAVAMLGSATSTALAPGTIIAWSLLWQATVWLSALPGAVAHCLHKK